MKILLTPEAHSKIIAMFQAVTTEVGAMMSGRIVEGGDVLVEDIFITSQVVSGADVDFTEEGVDQATLLGLQDGKIIVGWVHSHGAMKQFWSGTDERAITKLLEHTGTWLVSIVGNHACNMLGRIDYYSDSPFGRQRVKCDDLQISVVSTVTEDIRETIKSAIDANVTTRVTQAYAYGGGFYGSDWSKDRKWGKKNSAVVKVKNSVDASAESAAVASIEVDAATRESLITFFMSQGMSEEDATKEVDEQ